MSYKISILLLAAVIGSALAAIIELNDHNNNLLPLDTSKALRTVQDALANGFKFESVKGAIKFVDHCKYLQEATKDLADSEYEGLAGKMKALLQDEQLVQVCSIQQSQLADQFGILDNENMGVNVSKKRMNEILELGKSLDANPNIKVLLDDLYNNIKGSMKESLLMNAAEDTTTYFGERRPQSLFKFDLGDTYKSGCSISALKPVCKLVRQTSSDDVTALGSDVAAFTKALESKEQSILDKHVQVSGVSLDSLKSACDSINGNWHPLRVLDAYQAAGLISDAEVDEQSKVDAKFYLYNELYKLCKVALSA